MGAKAWLDTRTAGGNKSVPTEAGIKAFLSGNVAPPPGAAAPFVYICRCGAHTRVVRAITRAALEMTQ